MKKSDGEQVIVSKEPKLNSPCLVAAWPGVANVALEATTYLKDKLEAEEFARIQAPSFFEVTGVYVEKNLIQPPRLPENKLYFWKRKGKGKGSDLVIFLAEAQPSSMSREFADILLDLVQGLGVKTVYTCAAALIPHFPEEPRVWAAATDTGLLEETEKQGLVLKGGFLHRRDERPAPVHGQGAGHERDLSAGRDPPLPQRDEEPDGVPGGAEGAHQGLERRDRHGGDGQPGGAVAAADRGAGQGEPSPVHQ